MLEPDQVGLLESPCSLIVGTVDATNLPDATRGWGVEVDPAGERIRLLVASNALATHENLRTTSVIALTATHFRTLVSVQVKGRMLRLEPATGADQIRYDQFTAEVVRDLTDLEGTPAETLWRMAPPGIVACELSVEAVFDQTPGPAAGARLAPAGA